MASNGWEQFKFQENKIDEKMKWNATSTATARMIQNNNQNSEILAQTNNTQWLLTD